MTPEQKFRLLELVVDMAKTHKGWYTEDIIDTYTQLLELLTK